MIETSTDRRLVDGPLGRATLRFGLPLALAMAFHGLFNCVDLVIVGRLGSGAIAAVTAAGIVNMVAMLLFAGIGNSIAAEVSREIGAGRPEAARAAIVEAFWLTVWTSVILGGGFFLMSRPLLGAFAADAETSANGVRYLQILSLGAPTMFFLLYATSVLRALGDAFWPTIALVLANVLNIVLDIALVFGLWGAPRLEIAGAAWATGLARAIGAIPAMIVLFRPRNGIALHFRDFRSWRPTTWTRTFLVDGLTSSGQLVVRVVGIYMLLAFATRATSGSDDATDLLDGVGICIRLEMIAVFFGMGWGSAAAAVVGQNLGAGRPDRARRGTWIAITASAGLAAILGLAILVFARPVFHLIAPDLSAAALDAGRTYLFYTVPAYALIQVGVVMSQALTGAGAARTALRIDTGAYLLVLGGFGWVATRIAGLDGGWGALVAAHVLAAALYARVLLRRPWEARQDAVPIAG